MDEKVSPEPTLTYTETCLHDRISGGLRGAINSQNILH